MRESFRFLSPYYLIYCGRILLKKYALFFLGVTLLLKITLIKRSPRVNDRILVVVLPPPLGMGDILMLSPLLEHLHNHKALSIYAANANPFQTSFQWQHGTSITSLIKDACKEARERDGTLVILKPSLRALGLLFFYAPPSFCLACLDSLGISTRGITSTRALSSYLRLTSSGYLSRAVELLEHSGLLPLSSSEVEFKRAPLKMSVVTKNRAIALLHEHTQHKKLIALAPFVTWRSRRWPVTHWKTLTTMLINAEMVPLFIGGADSSSYTEEILQGVAPELVLNYTGSTNLEESASLLSAVDALISSDSGVMHVGMSCGTPLVALFGSTPSRDRIEGVPAESLRIIEGYAHCRLAPCYSGYGEVVCPFNHECINHILPEEVYENLISLLDSRARNRCESIPRD